MPTSTATRNGAEPARAATVRREGLRIAGTRVDTEHTSEVFNPYTGELVGTVGCASVADVRRAIAAAKAYRPKLTRYERYRICYRTAEALRARTEEIANLITAESGLCKKDSTYEVGRACDVFLFAGNAALQDDGQVFSCDLTAHGKRRKVY
ncbi:MAG: aldehyde dehydrogenase family protein, partial [Sinobacteraceae bacterium]|nr:aldehyde dehydrogenase family protein [Nevskiaceae bacterium]